ncbi:H-NS histone family protein [Cereibacter johrii]|uniref:H-NS histone family protein n=1 Tax=Cereibacter johrii TaxID=445629 RepID=UPI000C6DBFA2|nr:H-NS histone family protein [Cereibacter johrii]MEA5163343.1 H-NS histone family protein [Cereibacter johrii]
MNNILIDSMSLKELKSLQAEVVKAIADYEHRRRREALAELEEKAREFGFSLAELTGVAPVKRRPMTPPKYANPANPTDTWSGRGRKPRWFEEAVTSGRKAESMLI